MARADRVFLAAVASLVLFAGVGPARQSTWAPATTDWNTANNWSPAGVPNSTSTPVIFADAGVGTVNISSSVSAQSLTFTNQANNYSLTSSTNQTLTVASSITMIGGPTTIDAVNLANVSTGSLLFTNGNLTISNNTTNGGSLVIGPSTVIGTAGLGGVVFSGAGAMFLNGSFAAPGSTEVVGGLTKTGPGLLIFSGSGANLNGAMTLNGGTLELDYSSSTASKVQTTGNSGLILEGGSLLLVSNPGTPLIQSFPGGTLISAGHTDVLGGGTGTIMLAAGVIAHALGGTVDFSPSASSPTFSIQTSTGNTNGLLGGGPAFATVNNGAGWATVSGVVVAPLAGYSTNIYTSGANTDVTANSLQSNITTNSLRFNAGSVTLTLSGANVLQSGGILVTPSFAGGVITGGTLAAPSSGELLVHVYSSNGITINSALVSTAGLTKTGPDLLTLAGNNTGLTGPINVNRGGIDVQLPAAVNSASAINLNDVRSSNAFGGLQQLTVDLGNNNNQTINPPIRLSAFSATDYGTYFSTGFSLNSRVTISGVISSTNGLNTPIRFTGATADTSGFNLTNTNTFTGNVSLFQGYLGITSDASLGNAANILNLQVEDPLNGGLVFLNGGVNIARPVQSSFLTRLISNGTDSNTISGPISGTAGIYKDGTGTLTIANSGNTVAGGVTVAAGTLSLGATGSLPAGTNITVSAGATFSPGTTSNTLATTIGQVTLNGGTFRVPAGTGQQFLVNSIATGAAGGTVDYTGVGADQLVIFGSATGIAINGNSTWLSPANGTTIVGGDFPVTIPAGVTFTNGIALASGTFTVSGGGTLFQNSDATNSAGMAADVIVSGGSRFRVTDASGHAGVGNLGTGAFELNGGSFAYGGLTASTNHAIGLTTNGGTIEVESAGTTFTIVGAIVPVSPLSLGPLTKIGPGTLTLANASNSFSSLTINAGTVQTASDLTLGAGPITVGGAGTLNYSATTSTSRIINLVFGALSVGSGATLTLNGAAVNGGFVVGPGAYAVTGGASLTGVTTYASTPITVTGAGSFTNFTNGGALTVVAGPAIAPAFTRFTNQGSGSITIGAASAVNLADFQSYGTLTLTPAGSGTGFHTLATNTGSTPLNFNGGSRTFIGTPQTASQFLAGIDLHGQNAIVAGGLFVNNGFVGDSSNGGAGTATIIADFGSLVKGAGFFQNSVITQNGGKFQAGNSPGISMFGSLTIGPGGLNNFGWQINDAGPSTTFPRSPGTAGPLPDANNNVSGWSLLASIQGLRGESFFPGDLTWTAISQGGNQFRLALETLMGPTTPVGQSPDGPMADFDPNQPYVWPVITFQGRYSGPTDSAALTADTLFDTSQFANPINGTFTLQLDQANKAIDLVYTPTPVPEPGTMLLTAAGLAAVYLRRRRTISLTH